MANRNYKPGAMAIEKGTIKLYGRVVYGAAGAIASQDCRGFAVTDGGVGIINIALEDEYNALYNCTAVVVGATPLTWAVTSEDVGATPPVAVVTLSADPADGESVLLEITLKNSTVKY